MSAGTLTLTNDTDAVTGSGTAFTTELAAGDFIVVTVGGIPYTLPVKAVNNNTSLTLVSVYTGPTQSGAAWSAVPRVALNMVTAALVAQSAEALRGLNYDKQNWQQFFTAEGDVTITLPDTSQTTGPSAKKLISEMGRKADKSSLGTAAEKNTGTSASDVMQPGMFGLGRPDGVLRFNTTNQDELLGGLAGYGTVVLRNDQQIAEPWGIWNYSPCIFTRAGDTQALLTLPFQDSGRVKLLGGSASIGWSYVRTFWDDKNTTTDSNGFIKKASPIVKVFGDGNFETNGESAGCTVTRMDVGKYLINGCLGINADTAWGGIDGGFEIPVDRNKQARIWLDYEVNADGSVLVKTYHRTHPQSPEFARNEIDNLTNGDPIDIPPDSFVSVRVEMPSDSIWNKKQEATRIAMEEARMKEERTDGNNV